MYCVNVCSLPDGLNSVLGELICANQQRVNGCPIAPILIWDSERIAMLTRGKRGEASLASYVVVRRRDGAVRVAG